MRAALYRSATRAGTCVFIAQVRPGLPLAPNLWPAAKMTLGASGSAASAVTIEQVAGDGLDAGRGKPIAHRRIAETGDADDAPRRRRALGEAGQRRPHLAGDAEDDQIAVDARELVDESLARQRQ